MDRFKVHSETISCEQILRMSCCDFRESLKEGPDIKLELYYSNLDFAKSTNSMDD